jgi:molecular chaperone IbpA
LYPLETQLAISQIVGRGATTGLTTTRRPAVKGGDANANYAFVAQGGLSMRAIDFAPLYRSTVGFDRLFSILDGLAQPEQVPAYPPYNIERTGENAYRISMAVAGFAEDEITIESRENTLTVKGEKTEKKDGDEAEFLFRGIASRSFERRFQLADHVEVKTASLENGLLHIELVREIPEAMKPRRIEIAKPGKKLKQIEAKAAA